MAKMTPAEREQIIAALKAGQSQNAVAKQLGRSASTINLIAKDNGIAYTAPKNAAQARSDYAQEKRLSLLNRLFERAEEMADTVSTPGQLQVLTVAVGTLIDKRRLEDGEATSRSEVNTHEARERLAGRIAGIAARNGAAADTARTN